MLLTRCAILVAQAQREDDDGRRGHVAAEAEEIHISDGVGAASKHRNLQKLRLSASRPTRGETWRFDCADVAADCGSLATPPHRAKMPQKTDLAACNIPESQPDAFLVFGSGRVCGLYGCRHLLARQPCTSLLTARSNRLRDAVAAQARLHAVDVRCARRMSTAVQTPNAFGADARCSRT